MADIFAQKILDSLQRGGTFSGASDADFGYPTNRIGLPGNPQQTTMPQAIYLESPQGRLLDDFMLPRSSSPRNRLEELYNPETEMTNEYKRLLANRPQRNTPGLMRKILASAAGFFGGPQTADQLMYGGYNREMADYNDKLEAYAKGAGLENTSNQNARQIAASVMSNDAAMERNRITEENNLRRTQIAEKNLQIKAAKRENPNWIFKEVDGGDIWAINPVTLETRNTGLKSNEMDELTKMEVGFKNRMQIIDAQSQAALNRALTVAGAQNQYALGQIAARGDQQRQTDAADPSGSSGGDSPNQQKIALYNKAQQAFNSNPAWAKYITLGEPSTNTFQLAVPPQGASAQDWTNYKDAYRYIYGVEPSFDQTPNTPQSNAGKPVAGRTPTVSTKTKPPKPTNTPEKGYVILYNKKQGVWGQVPENAKARAIASGEFEE